MRNLAGCGRFTGRRLAGLVSARSRLLFAWVLGVHDQFVGSLFGPAKRCRRGEGGIELLVLFREGWALRPGGMFLRGATGTWGRGRRTGRPKKGGG